MAEQKENPQEKKGLNLLGRFRSDFFYGLLFILPVIATIWLVLFSIDVISGPVSALFGKKIPTIASFILTIVFITLIGLTARNILGRAVLKYFERMMERIPIVNVIYKAIKQIINSFSFKEEKLLAAVLVEYPRKGIWCLAFITKDNPSGMTDINGLDHAKGKVALFVPTTPNPTSGYFIYVEKSEITKLDVSIEDSVKVLMSAGVLSPETIKNKIKK